jgi:hypothetical protein
LIPTIATLVAYVGTMAPGVLGGDAGELQFVSPILGLTHPTGYPLLVLSNHLWSNVFPFASIAWRITLLNAIFAACAVGVTVLVARATTGSWLASIVGALFLAFAPIYWSQATGSDKYTLNALLLALVILAALRWSHQQSDGRLRVLALLYGLSLTNHRSMLLAAPALFVFLIANGWRPVRRAQLLGPLLLAVLPLVLYLYVPWAGARGLPPGTWPVGTPSELLEFFLDRGYTSQIQIDGGSVSRLFEFGRVTLNQLTPIGVALGALGAGYLLLRQPSVFVLIALILAPNVLTAANYVLPSNYAMPRFWVFFIPAYLCWAIFISVGIRLVLSAANKALRPGWSLTAAVLTTAAIALAGAALVWAPTGLAQARAHRSAETLDGYRQDLQRGYLADRFARLALQEAAPEGIIVGDWEQSTPLWYMQYVEGARPDVLVRYPIERLQDTLSDPTLVQRPVYLTRVLPGLELPGPTTAVGPLIQVRGQPSEAPASANVQIDANLGDAARLLGVTYLLNDLRVGSVLPLVVYWQALGEGRQDASVSVRLVNTSGDDVAQSDAAHPVLGTSPISRWHAGEVVADYHELALSNRLAPGEYRVETLLYRGPSGTPLVVTGRDANDRKDRARLPSVQVRS